MAETIIVKIENNIAVLLLNRPQAYNAFDLDMIKAFAEHLISLAVDKAVRGIVITGNGKAFCAGGDLKWAAGFHRGPRAAFHELAGRLHQAVLEIRRMQKPVISAINGIAAGAGFSLALACDFRIMAKSATLRQAYTSNGLCINGGGTFMLPRIVGLARALEIAAFDKPISSAQAITWGLVTRVVEDGYTLEEAKNIAIGLTKISLNSFGWSKQLFTDSFNTSFETQIENERRGLSICAAHADGIEGLKAFAEKRPPVFGGKKNGEI